MSIKCKGCKKDTRVSKVGAVSIATGFAWIHSARGKSTWVCRKCAERLMLSLKEIGRVLGQQHNDSTLFLRNDLQQYLDTTSRQYAASIKPRIVSNLKLNKDLDKIEKSHNRAYKRFNEVSEFLNQTVLVKARNTKTTKWESGYLKSSRFNGEAFANVRMRDKKVHRLNLGEYMVKKC